MSSFINRRQFLGRAMAGGAVLTAGLGRTASAASPNNQVVVGVLGMSRGRELARMLAEHSGCIVKYACDTDRNRAEVGASLVTEAGGRPAQAVQDLRRVLDDPEVDAVAMALPVHWHAPAAIMALQAGKHVYVEKPCCHNPNEGEMLVAAARKYNRAVQMGNQRRSWPGIREGMERLHAGIIGRVYYARTWYANQRPSIGTGTVEEPPEHLDYELWQGPAPRQPFKSNLIHYNWHWHWHWGTGEIGNNGTHGVDLGRWGLGVDYPIRVTSAGGRYRYDDDQETPDTHMVTWDFSGGKTMVWEGLSCNRPGLGGSDFGAAFHGEEGSLVVEGTGYAIFDPRGQLVERNEGPRDDAGHLANFLDAIREDQPRALNSEIEEGYKSTLLCLLGNIAHRAGRCLECAGNGRLQDTAAAQSYWRREYAPGWEPEV